MALLIPAQVMALSETSQAWIKMKTDKNAKPAFGVEGLKPVINSDKIPAGKFKKDPPWKIAQAFNGFGNTWRIQIAEEMKHEAAKNPEIEKYIFVEADNDPVKQVSQIQDLLTQGIDALIVAPAATDNCNELIAKAVSMGIPVINVIESTTSKDVTVRIEADQWHFGNVMGKWLVKQLNGKGRIWMLKGIPGFAASVARDEGAYAAFKGTDIKVTSEGYGYWSMDKSRRLVENLLVSDPNPDGIWSAGATMSRAAIEVFEENGMPVPPITGEGENGFFKAWKKHDLKSMSAVFPPSLGIAGVRAAVALLKGEEVQSAYIHRPDPITTAEERDKYLRPDLSNDLWVPTTAPEELLQKLYGQK